MHGAVALVRHERREVPDIAPQTGKLERCRVFVSAARADRVVNRVVAVRERNLAGDNARERAVTLDAAAEADGLEERLRRGAERRNRSPRKRVSEANPLEGVPP